MSCNTMQYHTIPCSTMQYRAIPCNTLQYNAIPCNTMQYRAISCNTMQHHALLCSTHICVSICIYVYLFQVARLETHLCVSVYLDARLGVILSAHWVAQWEGFESGGSVTKGLNRLVIYWQDTFRL